MGRSEREGPESRVHGQLRQLEELLSDAERLLAFAASTGIEVGDDVRRSIISASALPRHGWTDEDTSSFLRAMTALSARLKPVSAESLRKCDVNAEASRTLFRFRLYQEVRTFAQSVQEMVQTSFGAVTICVLPVLYALLGACAFLIRSFEEQRKTRTFTSTGKFHARFLIAGIGGLVVGLFRNFSDAHDNGLSPLAIAFMVGYGVDVFFFFIDGLLETFARTRNARAEHASNGEGVATH